MMIFCVGKEHFPFPKFPEIVLNKNVYLFNTVPKMPHTDTKNCMTSFNTVENFVNNLVPEIFLLKYATSKPQQDQFSTTYMRKYYVHDSTCDLTCISL